MVTHSSILLRILWTGDPGGIHSIGSQKSQTLPSNQTATTIYLPMLPPCSTFWGFYNAQETRYSWYGRNFLIYVCYLNFLKLFRLFWPRNQGRISGQMALVMSFSPLSAAKQFGNCTRPGPVSAVWRSNLKTSLTPGSCQHHQLMLSNVAHQVSWKWKEKNVLFRL